MNRSNTQDKIVPIANQPDKRPQVLVAVPNMGSLRTELAFNFLQWASDGRFRVRVIAPKRMRPIPAARNYIVNTFLNDERNYDYLLMIDSDMSGPANLLDLCALDKAMVGALCLMLKDEGIMPTIHERYGHGYRIPPSVPANELIEVDATGTGCFVVRRDVLETIEPPYFEYVLDKDSGELQLGQDYYFCMKVKEAGFKIYVHTGYVTSHDQTVDLARMFFSQKRQHTGQHDPWGGAENITDGNQNG